MGVWVGEVVGRVDLGDQRLTERLRTLIRVFSERPAGSVPETCETWAATMGAYRFFRNGAVDFQRVIDGVAEATVERSKGRDWVLAVQDTTSLDYTTHTKTTGLGPLENTARSGLFLHSTLAVGLDGVPLGLLELQPWARDRSNIGKAEKRKELPVEAKESLKWLSSLKRTEQLLQGSGVQVISVADREADVYELFALAAELDGHWLIRARHNRKLEGEEGKLESVIEQAPICAQVIVELAREPNRPARKATLEVRRAQVTLAPPWRAQGVIERWWVEHPEVERVAPPELRPMQVGVVLAAEVDAPPGQEPVRWLLITSLPVETTEQVLACIEYYRLRWLVERFHFVLKSGCAVEKLQLQDAEALIRALATYSVVAWRLLWLTYEARAHPDWPCSTVLEEDAWRLLCALDRPKEVVPTTPPDLRTAVRAIAKLGGFLGRKGDGEPGVKTLWRGMRRLTYNLEAYQTLRLHPELLSILPTVANLGDS